MEAAYGLAITMCMISTSILFANYLVLHRVVSLLDLSLPGCLSYYRNFFSYANLKNFHMAVMLHLLLAVVYVCCNVCVVPSQKD